MKPLVIGLTGIAGAGKDSAASQLVLSLSQLGYSVMRAGFADPIRDMLRALGVPDRYMVERELKEKPVPGLGASYRHMAQTLGTEWGRNLIGQDFWLSVLRKRFEESPHTALVMTDVRFPNEAQWTCLDMDGYLLRLVRPGVAAVIPHESEAHVARLIVDLEITNDGTLQDLDDKVHDQAILLAAENQRPLS